MSSYEHERYELHQGLAAELGPEKAATLMSYLPPVHWGEVATKHDLAVLRDQMATKTDLANIEVKISNLEAKLTNEIASWGRTIAVTTVSSILAAVALSFAAARLG